MGYSVFEITSKTNQKIKYVESLFNRKNRDNEKAFLVEGKKFVDEIPLDWDINYFLLSDSFVSTFKIDNYLALSDVYLVSDKIFGIVSDTISPQGILAVCQQKLFFLSDFKTSFENGDAQNALIIILENIQDPGNLGTIIRIADSANASGIIISENAVDLYNPKTIRSTAGSVFHLPIIVNANLSMILPQLKDEQITIFAACLEDSMTPYQSDLSVPLAVLIGNEANGLSNEILEFADYKVKIPILGRAESLNASVACGILTYEILRQRHFKE